MLWFLFVIGFLMAILGVFIMASDYDIEIKERSFDDEMLGGGLLAIGGVLAVLMLSALGISWVASLG